jgi:hypothetical protein
MKYLRVLLIISLLMLTSCTTGAQRANIYIDNMIFFKNDKVNLCFSAIDMRGKFLHIANVPCHNVEKYLIDTSKLK